MRIVYIGFKNRQKLVFSKFLFWFVIFSWKYIFPENLTCTRLFFTEIDFLSMVFVYHLKRPQDMDWVVQKNSGFLFLSEFCMENNIWGGGGTSSENIDPIWAFKKYIRSQISNFDFSPVSRTVHLNSRLKSRTRLDCRHFEFRNNK